MRALATAFALAGFAGAVHAEDAVRVMSPQARAVSITIYRDFFALVTETREVDLPAEPVTLVFENVVETLIPQSAVMVGADRPISEDNYRYEPLTAASLIRKSVGKTVTLTRTNPATGRVTQEPATIVSAVDGVVLRLASGNEALHCSGLPEQLVFSQVPEELTAKPTLSVRLAAGAPGRRTIRLSYIAPGFSWRSDYAGHLNESSDRMQLTGWVTLDNFTNASFKAAEVQVVAGKLNLVSAEEGGSQTLEGREYMDDQELAEAKAQFMDELRERRAKEGDGSVGSVVGCYPMGPPRPSEVAVPSRAGRRTLNGYGQGDSLEEEIIVTAQKRASREVLADYQLYRLPWATDLNARQTKQVVFLVKPAVKVDRFYGFRLGWIDDAPSAEALQPNVMLRWENTRASGLGEPLPYGRARFFEPYGDHDVFAGEAMIADKSVGLPVELAIGRALNVRLDFKSENADEGTRRRQTRLKVAADVEVINGKSQPIVFEFRHALGAGWTDGKVSDANRRPGKKYGDFAWRFTIEPDAREDLHYVLRASRDSGE